ncbi:MAG: flagellar hook-length control protein FliK [Parasphingorhabdus sp.]|nr:flagellar hook-length control protein FliK [Parasphingorhabdus sp.]
MTHSLAQPGATSAQQLVNDLASMDQSPTARVPFATLMTEVVANVPAQAEPNAPTANAPQSKLSEVGPASGLMVPADTMLANPVRAKAQMPVQAPAEETEGDVGAAEVSKSPNPAKAPKDKDPEILDAVEEAPKQRDAFATPPLLVAMPIAMVSPQPSVSIDPGSSPPAELIPASPDILLFKAPAHPPQQDAPSDGSSADNAEQHPIFLKPLLQLHTPEKILPYAMQIPAEIGNVPRAAEIPIATDADQHEVSDPALSRKLVPEADVAAPVPAAVHPITVREIRTDIAAPPMATQPGQPTLNLANDDMWIGDLGAHIRQLQSGQGKLAFALTPDTLGAMRVELLQSDDGDIVRLSTTNADAQSLVAGAQARLEQDARHAGMRLQRIEVVLENDAQTPSFSQGTEGRNDRPQAQNIPQQIVRQMRQETAQTANEIPANHHTNTRYA